VPVLFKKENTEHANYLTKIDCLQPLVLDGVIFT